MIYINNHTKSNMTSTFNQWITTVATVARNHCGHGFCLEWGKVSNKIVANRPKS